MTRPISSRDAFVETPCFAIKAPQICLCLLLRIGKCEKYVDVFGLFTIIKSMKRWCSRIGRNSDALIF